MTVIQAKPKITAQN